MSDSGGIPSRYISKNTGRQGGMGDVSFYFDEVLERDVAIKSMLNISNISRLRDEIDALLRLRSKYVVQVFDLIQHSENNVAIIMERIHGQELSEYRFEKSDKEVYLKILWQIAAGLTDIHEQGVVHRDIKPQNMMLDAEGILKILDFGLARQLEYNAATAGFRGTYGYAAPEQYTSEHFEFTSAIDVYAFSAVALFLLNGRLPKELMEIPPAPLEENPFLSTWLSANDDLCSTLHLGLNHDVLQRPSMNQIKLELEKLLLKDMHQATIVFGDRKKIRRINSENRTAGIKYGNVGSFKVVYSGYEFELSEFTGNIFVNNMEVRDKRSLPKSCVITIGAPELKWERAFITFDVSNPEVTL